MKRLLKILRTRLAPLLVVGLVLFGCSSGERFTQQSVSQFFVQDFVPEFLDILWVIDDRSAMFPIRSQLMSEASAFFQRLDGAAHQYRMAFISGDMLIAKGALKPTANPVILTKNFGTVEQRTANFSTIISQLINLRTGGVTRSFEAAVTALGSTFVTRENIPLVLVFISDSDDASVKFDNSRDAVEQYAERFIELKGGNKDLLRVYSVNYVKDGDTCTRHKDSADIKRSDFEDRFFRLANELGGSTADLCGSFSNEIDLSGLRLEELSTRYQLEAQPAPETIVVQVFLNGQLVELDWSYQSQTNEIVFVQPPPEGATIQVTFLPSGARQTSTPEN